MRRLATGVLLAAFLMAAVSCGTQATQSSPTRSSAGEPTTNSGPSEDQGEVEKYLVEMANLAADTESALGDFECSYNEQFSPGACGQVFVEEGEEVDGPPRTEEEQFAYQRGLWLGMFELRVAHADVLETIAPPQGFETAHRDFVDAYRTYFNYLMDQVAGYADLEALHRFFDAVFDPLDQLSPGNERLLLALVESCQALERLGADAGYRADLGCQEPPPVPVPVAVQIGEFWTATPNPLSVGDGLVRMTITNTGSVDVRPVVVQIFSGDPLDLPVIEGLVDLSRDGMMDPGSGFAKFGLAYAGHDQVFIDESGVTGEPPVLPPGESVEAAIWSERTIVVFDYAPGEFEAGAYVVVERSRSP